MTKNYFAANERRGAALVLVSVLLALVFIAIAFSVDIARLQLAQMELQSVADLSARAGAEAMARGVADPTNNGQLDDAVRKEVEMIAELNGIAGFSIDLDRKNEVTFGSVVAGAGGVGRVRCRQRRRLPFARAAAVWEWMQ